MLARAYHYGAGVPQDAEQEMVWTRRAAERGSPLAAYRLSGILWNGSGKSQNKIEALRWMTIAVQCASSDGLRAHDYPEEVQTMLRNAQAGFMKEMTATEISAGEKLASDWLFKFVLYGK